MSMPRTATVSLQWRDMVGSLFLVTPRRGGTAGTYATRGDHGLHRRSIPLRDIQVGAAYDP
jgi:hypothetical protein